MQTTKQATKRPLDDARQEIQALVDELATLRDETKLQAHLARMDVRTRWDELTSQHAELLASLQTARHEAGGAIRASLTELRDAFRKIHEDAADPEC